ncbi:MAG: HNH endonuclease [Actinomycetota bacterium]|nr:HNH endonuclease [Actinomycetota bacterium]
MLNVDLDTPIDTLERELIARERLITRLRCEQTELLRILDVAQVHHMDGAATLREWTRARVDVSDSLARDLVDAAKAISEQPGLVEAADAGELSFDRLVATSRLVASGADDDTVKQSFGYDLSGVGRLRTRHRRLSRRSETDIFADRYLSLQESLDGSRGRLHGELPGFEFRILGKALEERADMFGDLPGPRVGRPQRLADALVSISQDSFEPPAESTTSDTAGPAPTGTRSEPLATVFVDATVAGETHGEAGAEVAYGPQVGPQTLERILCTGKVQVVGLVDGRPVSISNAARDIPPAIRRFVAWRDGGCTIEGCRSRYRLQPHHIRHREHDGDHDPDNLTTLCWYHHHVAIHGMGLELDPDSPPQCRRFLRTSQRRPDPP